MNMIFGVRYRSKHQSTSDVFILPWGHLINRNNFNFNKRYDYCISPHKQYCTILVVTMSDTELITRTENGAVSLATTGSACLNLFFKTVRNTPPEALRTMLSEAWAESPLDTLRIIFNLRDIRSGKGERKQFQESLKWLCENGRDRHVLCNLENIPHFGTFKDIWTVCGTPVEGEAIKYFADQLRTDIQRLKATESGKHCEISLAAKWAPTEGSALDKKSNLCKRLCGALTKQQVLNPLGWVEVKNLRDYRKNLIVPLRNQLDIVEHHTCSGDWANIDFEKCPSVAMNMYRKAFLKHQTDRFKEYLTAVKAGTAKINATAVFPHTLVAHYMNHSNPEVDETVEAQWKALVENLRQKFGTEGRNFVNARFSYQRLVKDMGEYYHTLLKKK